MENVMVRVPELEDRYAGQQRLWKREPQATWDEADRLGEEAPQSTSAAFSRSAAQLWMLSATVCVYAVEVKGGSAGRLLHE